MKNKGLKVPEIPEEIQYVTLPLTIPDTPEWRGVFCGLLYSLSFGYWWDKNSGDWEKAKQLGYEIALRTCMSADICTEVAECIDGSETIREIIREIIKETTTGGGGTGGGRGLGVGVTSLAECHPDNVFGAVTGLVNYQIQAIRDALELLETATNRAEFILDWLGDSLVIMPIIGTIANWVAWVQDNISENFEAQLTTALIDEYRCDLFCLYQENDCAGLTSSQIAQYYLDRVGGVDLLENLEDLLNFFITGEFTGTQIVDVMMAGSIAMMVVDLNWIPFVTIPTLYSLDMIFSLSADDPSNDWTVLCDPCTEPIERSYCWFIDDNFPAWTPFAVGSGRQNPVYDATNKWFRALPITINGTGKEGRISFTLPANYDVRVEASVDKKNTRTSGTAVLTVYTGTSSQIGNAGSNATIATNTVDIDHTLTDVNTINILWRCSTNTQGESETLSYARLTFIKLTLTASVNPFPPENCPV